MAAELALPLLRRLVVEHRIFTILMLLALVLNVYLLSAFPVQKIWGDEIEYIRLSHREQSFAAKVKRLIPGFMYFEWWPPFAFGVYSLLAGPETSAQSGELLAENLVPVGEYAGFLFRISILNLILFLITASNIYWLCLLSGFGKKTATVASGLFLFNPRILFYIQALWPEMLHFAMLSWGLTLLVLYDSRRRSAFLVLSSVIFGFCSLTKGIVDAFLILLLPILAFRVYTHSRKNLLVMLKTLAIFYGCFLAVNLPQRISNHAAHGTFSISTNRWINIELGFIPFAEFKVNLFKRYRMASQDPLIREEMAKRRVLDYIKNSSKLKLLANQTNRFVLKQLNRSFLFMGLKKDRWVLESASGFLGVVAYNIAIILSWFIFLFGICGLIMHRSLSFGSIIISIYAVLYLLFVFIIVHNERFFIQELPFLGIFAISFLMSVKWRSTES